MICNFPAPITSIIILLFSTRCILETCGQRHRDSCFNSALLDDTIPEATAQQYNDHKNCFEVKIWPYVEPRTLHITFFFNYADCRSFKGRFGTVEVMARGNFKEDTGTRFPLGQMTRAGQWLAPCRPWPSDPTLKKDHIEYQQIAVAITCDPPVIKDHKINPGELDLSVSH